MGKKTLLNIVAGLGVLTAVLHITANALSLYWRLRWFDIPMHFLGGVFIAFLLIWFFYWSGYTRLKTPSPRAFFVSIIGGTIIVGIGWEVFEYLLGVSWRPEGYWFDTIKDMSMDVIGAVIATFIFNAMQRRSATIASAPASKIL